MAHFTSGVGSLKIAGFSLNVLRGQRNQADYDMDATAFRSSGVVVAMVLAAPRIVDSLQRCRAEPTFSEMRAKIRTYARDVLRIGVI